MVDSKLSIEKLNSAEISHRAARRVARLFGLDQTRCEDLTIERARRSAYLRWNAVDVRTSRTSIAASGRRRVSGKALAIHSYHRESWDNPAFGFDPETLELLTEICPVCHQELGWRRAVPVHMCDNCLDQRQLPRTDLREFPRASPEVADEEGFRTFADLLIPWHEGAQRRMAQCLFGHWGSSRTQALGQIAFFLADLLRAKYKEIVARFPGRLPTSTMAYAGRVMLEGRASLAGALEDIAASSQRSWRGESPWELMPAAKAILDLARSKGRGVALSTRYQATMATPGGLSGRPKGPRLEKDRYPGPQKDFVRGHRTYPLQSHNSALVPDAQEIDRICDILGINPTDVKRLVRSGDLEKCLPEALTVLPHTKYVSASSLRAFMAKVMQGSTSLDGSAIHWVLISIRTFNSREKPYPWSDIMRALAHSTVTRFTIRSEKSACWLDTLCIVAPGNRWAAQRGTPIHYGNLQGAPDTRITFDAPPVTEDQELVGSPELCLMLASDQTDGLVIAYLEDVAPDGRVTYLTEGQLRLLHRATAGEPCDTAPGTERSFAAVDGQLVVPGETMRIELSLLPVAARIAAGHHLRLSLAGADAGWFDPLTGDATATWTVYYGSPHGSSLMVPLRPWTE